MHSLIIIAAKYLILLPVLVFAWLWLRQPKDDKIKLAWTIVIAGLIAGLLDKIGSRFFYDTRPFVAHHLTPLIHHAADNGFPSEHTLLAATIAMVVSFYNRKLGLVLAVTAILIGAARVAAHVHSPIDIIGSIAMAVFAGWSARLIVKRWVVKGGDGRQ